MDVGTNRYSAEYHCRKRITNPEEFKKAEERIANPNILTGKDAVFALYQIMGMKIDYDSIFEDWEIWLSQYNSIF